MDGVSAALLTAALLTGAACCLGGVALLVKAGVGSRAWKQKLQRARNKREDGFRRAEERVLQYKTEHPTTETTPILTLSLLELQEKLQQGSVSPEEVFFSYMEKALALQSKLNCCTEVLLESFDQVKTVGFNKEGLLYGVPFSIKDNVGHKNYDSTCGLIINLDKPATNDSVIVEVLKKQGAIPFVKTNIPQALLSTDCSNPIFGETVNPHHALKSPGGSSGGEGALIAGGGSLLGIGTDIGGSIRVPASFCGICGLKPTSGRLSLQGIAPILPGQKSVKSTVGPMARDVDSLARLMEALLCDHMFFLDPTVPPLPFNKQIYQSSSPLRIGYLINDGITQPSPSMARAMREVKALLEKAGHVLVPYHPLNMERLMTELDKGALADGGATLHNKLKGGPVDSIFLKQYFLLCVPVWMRKILAFFLKPLCSRASEKIKSLCGVGSIVNLWENHVFFEEYTAETVAYWRKCNIDVLLCPAPGPAYQPKESTKILHSLSLTMIYNGLNFPAGVVPVTTVTAEDEEELKSYKGYYQDVLDKYFKEVVCGGEGLPVAVQCVALPWQDELCLRFMREVEKLVKESRN